MSLPAVGEGGVPSERVKHPPATSAAYNYISPRNVRSYFIHFARCSPYFAQSRGEIGLGFYLSSPYFAPFRPNTFLQLFPDPRENFSEFKGTGWDQNPQGPLEGAGGAQ